MNAAVPDIPAERLPALLAAMPKAERATGYLIAKSGDIEID